MKKILCLFITMFIIVMMTMVAFAADSSPTSESVVGNFWTWEFLGTMAGAIGATTLITQFLKMPLDKVWKVPTRFVVYVIAVIILSAYQLFTGEFTLDKAALIILNAIIVATAAMGTYETTFKKLEIKAASG